MSDLDPRPLVAVFYGGPSREHDVSLRSGAAVVRALPSAGFRALPVRVTRGGRFAFPPPDDPAAPAAEESLDGLAARLAREEPAAAFIALHGLAGEDGRLQALCEWMGLPHVGADVLGSAAAMDKWFAKALYRASGIPTAEAVLLEARDREDPGWAAALAARLGLPLVLKAPREGSSFGVQIVRSAADLPPAAAACAGPDGRLLAERFHAGRELSVPVLEDPDTGEPRALPVIEIVVKTRDFFDYEAKYDPSATDEVCPAPVPEAVARAVQDLALRAHRALCLSGFSRTDFIVDDAGPWALETNTIPGLTEASLFPKSAAVAGIPFPDLVGRLVRRAVSRGLPGRGDRDRPAAGR